MKPPSQLLVCASLLVASAFASAQKPLSPEQRLQEANAAFHAGYAAASNGDLNTARQQFQRAVQLAPQVEEGHSALGAVLYKLGDYAGAIGELETAQRLKTEDQSARENLALAYTQTGAYEKALPIFEHMDSNTSQPLSPDLLAAYARALTATQQYSAAIRETKAAIAAAPQTAALYDQLGSIYAQTQNWPEAQNAFAEALRLDPNFASAHLHLGIVLVNQRQDTAAIEELTTATRLDQRMQQRT